MTHILDRLIDSPIDPESDDFEKNANDTTNWADYEVEYGSSDVNNEDSLPQDPWKRERKEVVRDDGRVVIGRVGAPPQQEATSSKFCFWTGDNCIVEKSQIVTCESWVGGKLYTYYAIVDEVFRRSRKKSMAEEVDRRDGDLAAMPAYASEGYTFANATILRVDPSVLAPPREESEVLLANPDEAAKAFGLDEVENPLALGLIKNGGQELAGPGKIDLDYLLGANGGHLNVTGAAGRGTKSSFLMLVTWLLLHKARQAGRELPGSRERLRVVPIIFNVKNFDLFYLDRASKKYLPEKHGSAWNELGVEKPEPFKNVTFLAVQKPGANAPVDTGRSDGVTPYSYGLADIIEHRLLTYLFAEADVNDANFGALVMDIENWLTFEQIENDGKITRKIASEKPDTFEKLLGWVKDQASSEAILKNHHQATWKKVFRRLFKMTHQNKGLLRYSETHGQPLKLDKIDTSDPFVVDLHGLAGFPDLQRFVVAAIFHQLKQARTGENVVHGLVYLVVLDELNRFAPRGSHDPITELIELVAAEMRSQGIILLGAQQQASKVSERVIENCAIRVLGKTGSLELTTSIWSFLSASAKYKAQNLALDEKLVIQDNFREPMHLQVPFPAWAMNRSEAMHFQREVGNDSEPKDDLEPCLQPD